MCYQPRTQDANLVRAPGVEEEEEHLRTLFVP